MPDSQSKVTNILIKLVNNREALFPLFAISLIFIMLVSLPTWMLDILLAANLALAAVVLMTTIYVKSPLEFSVFPSLLLSVTLFRLVLNIASTRLILRVGAEGDVSTEEALLAAGDVIAAFSEFVAGENMVIGLIIFLIIFVIQFVVITKGATRVSEVAARFALDGMPGKQMAIDADLNAGIINEGEARHRREEITTEANFYGAMDGASKFVRGDAIAGIIITAVNIMGGLIIGMLQYNWDISKSMEVFTMLTIGDGLVSQVPAFIISISAGLIVTRTTAKTNLGEEIITQLTNKPRALLLAGGFMMLLTFTELPAGPLGMLALGCVGIAYVINRNRKKEVIAATAKEKMAKPSAKAEKVELLLPVDRMELEIGYALIKLVDNKQGGDLLNRISMIRRQIALELGIVVPSIRIRDNVRLGPNEYTINIKGVDVARGEAYPDQFMAMDSGAVTAPINGVETVEPAFGLPAVWVPASRKEQAEMKNYTVVDCSSVLATHLTEVIKTHAKELLTRQDLNSLLDTLKEKSPAVVEEVVGGTLKAGEIQKVLQGLLEERVSIRDLETILETLGDWGARTQDLEVLTEYVRNSLSRNICSQYRDDVGSVQCVTLDPALEELVNQHVERGERGSFLTLPPATSTAIITSISEQLQKMIEVGVPPVVLCSPQIRLLLRRLLAATIPSIAVLAYNEIVNGVEIQSIGMAVVES
jgi:flagellar biosynthesis protein FlhA